MGICEFSDALYSNLDGHKFLILLIDSGEQYSSIIALATADKER